MAIKKIAVVGGGIIGCSTVYHLSTLFPTHQCTITLISEKFSPYTTSDLSGGTIIPFDVTNPPCCDSVEGVGDIRRWARETIDHVEQLYLSRDAARIGVNHVYGCEAFGKELETPWWATLTHGFRRVTDKGELRAFNIPDECKTVFFFGLYSIDCRLYLPWLMENFQKNGGSVKQQKVTDLAKLRGEYDIVINCTGLGSSQLVADKELFPISGEAISVNAPWIKNFLVVKCSSKYIYVYPRTEDVLLGGTCVVNDWNTASNPEVSQSQLNACQETMPSLKNARVMSTWVGLRPGRSKIRLDYDKSFQDMTVIHCYGHGSKGISLHWGCAVEIEKMVSAILQEK